MHFDSHSGLLTLIRLLQVHGESGHPHMLGVLPDFGCWFLCLSFGRGNYFFYVMYEYDLLDRRLQMGLMFKHFCLCKLVCTPLF